MWLVNKSQRITRVIAIKQRRLNIAMSTTVEHLLDLLKASLGMSSERTGKNYLSLSWLSTFGHTTQSGTCMRATPRPAYVTSRRSPTTRRISH
jgi:hypothetical protein